ncbi:TonB-dependent receptor [Aliifodinibius sp. S!AR15-10]|uniref:TonB-dependent receptor family protein n=1 Tax=Aliifodinibius sp. S!AR15-10 TaxID=2950437 RepID=UPI002854B741|nr:TonB-dependent receptor [Aliifodinibius sp. S!AR15-10]MDR8391006.1 TonB-dependent receptor [Aliifodinibius sp. S!AR15-10]
MQNSTRTTQHFRLFSFITFICLALSSLVSAQNKNENPSDTLQASLEAIEIQATHSALSSEHPPISLSVLRNDQQTLTHKAPVTMDDLFDQVPGIWVNDRENYALGERITVRGIGWRAQFGVRGIQVVMDGVPLTMADGQAMLTVVDPIFIRRAELIRGPSSMFWGNSSGGVLYLNTTPPANTKSPFMVRSTIGSYGLIKNDVQFSQRFGKHGISGYASYLNQGGYRDHSEVTIGRAGVTGSVDLNANSRIEYFGAYANMPQAEHPSGLTKQQAQDDPTQANQGFQSLDAGKQISQGQFGVSFSNQNSLGFLKATAYGTYRDLENPLPFAIITLDRRAGGARATLQRDAGRFSFSFGAETKIQRDDRVEYDNDDTQRGGIQVDQIENVYNHAAFLTSTYTLNSLKLLGSVRYDWIRFDTDAGSPDQSGERDFQSVSPGVGINYSLGNVEFFSNLSTGFEAPTTTELVNRPGGGNGFNPDIQPEQTLGFELGSRGQLFSSRLSYDIALYNLWISDLLFPYQLEANGPTYYRNQGETVHRGVEANVQYDISRSLQAGLTYNLTDAEFTKATLDGEPLDGKAVPGVPQHRLSGVLHWRPGNFWLTTDAQHVSEFAVNNRNTAYNDAYWVVNGRVSYNSLPVGSGITVTPFLAVNNLFDARYNGSVVVNAFGGRYYEPAAGINWRTGLSLEF